MRKNEPLDSPERLDAAIRTTVYSEFVKSCRAPDVAHLADVVASTSANVEASLHRLADAHVIVLDDGNRIRMAMPFSAVPTPFRVTTETGTWFANCAWDALGIPAALGTDAQIHTSCADCREAITMEVRSGNLVDDSGVIHFAVPAAHWWDDIRFTWATILYFRSEEHVQQWCRKQGRDEGGIISLATGWRLAQAWYHDRLRPDWRRRTAEEAQNLFQSLGLVGEFWRLSP